MADVTVPAYSFGIAVEVTGPDGVVTKNPAVVIPGLTEKETDDMLDELTAYLTGNWTKKPKAIKGGKK